MSAPANDLDEWLVKLENLQRALKSCSSIPPRRPKPPDYYTADGTYFQDFPANEHCLESQTPLPHHSRLPQFYQTEKPEWKPIPTLGCPQPIARTRPNPPVRQTPNYCDIQPASANKATLSSVGSKNSDNNHLDVNSYNTVSTERRLNVMNNSSSGDRANNFDEINFRSGSVPSKSVRWLSLSRQNAKHGIQNLFQELKEVETELLQSSKQHTKFYESSLNEKYISGFLSRECNSAFRQNPHKNADSNKARLQFPLTDSNQSLTATPNVKATRQQIGTAFGPPSHKKREVARVTAKTANADECLETLTRWKTMQGNNETNHNSDNQETTNKTKIILRVHQPDRTTKAMYIHQNTEALEVVVQMAVKNFFPLSTKYALVEKVPSMKLERCFEDAEIVRDCILSWPLNCANLIFFEEREDLYGIIENPSVWLGNPFHENAGNTTFSLKDILGDDISNSLPTFKDYLYVLGKSGRWKRKYCVIRNSGLYASKKSDHNISDLYRITTFGDHLHLYTTSGGWTKERSPTPFGFVLKPYSAILLDPHLCRSFCASNESSLRTWCSLIRLFLNGSNLITSYQRRLVICTVTNQQADFNGYPSIGSFPALSSTSVNVVDSVRQKYAKESFSSAELRKSSRMLSRLPAVVRARSFSQIQQRLTRPESIRYSQCSLKSSEISMDIGGSSNDLGFVSGRHDVGRPRCLSEASSAVDLEHTKSSSKFSSSASSLNIRRGFGSFVDLFRASKRNDNGAPQTRHKFSRKGPAARRCDRSMTSHNRQSISPASSVFFIDNAATQDGEEQSVTGGDPNSQLSITSATLQTTNNCSDNLFTIPASVKPRQNSLKSF